MNQMILTITLMILGYFVIGPLLWILGEVVWSKIQKFRHRNDPIEKKRSLYTPNKRRKYTFGTRQIK